MNSKQGFKFEIPYSIKLIEEINKGINTKNALKDLTGAGENRIITFIEWLRYIKAIIIENQEIKLTKLGETYLKLKYSCDFLDPLMLYHLLRDPNLYENDGHFYYSTIVNDILYELVFDYQNTINMERIKKDMFKFGAEERYPEFITSTVYSLLDSQSGFGKMGLIEEINKNSKTIGVMEVHSYWVEPLVAAYIIYDMWKPEQTSISIDKIIKDKYNIGRIFLMDEQAVIETLEEIQALNLISLETIAGLNQIRINPKITKEDILDMMIEIA